MGVPEAVLYPYHADRAHSLTVFKPSSYVFHGERSYRSIGDQWHYTCSSNSRTSSAKSARA